MPNKKKAEAKEQEVVPVTVEDQVNPDAIEVDEKIVQKEDEEAILVDENQEEADAVLVVEQEVKGKTKDVEIEIEPVVQTHLNYIDKSKLPPFQSVMPLEGSYYDGQYSQAPVEDKKADNQES